MINDNELILPNDNTGIKLKEVTCLVLENWPAFKLGFDYGTHSKDNLNPAQIIDQFGTLLAAFIISKGIIHNYNCLQDMDVQKEDIQEFIEQYLDSKFQIIVEDGSSGFVPIYLK